MVFEIAAPLATSNVRLFISMTILLGLKIAGAKSNIGKDRKKSEKEK